MIQNPPVIPGEDRCLRIFNTPPPKGVWMRTRATWICWKKLQQKYSPKWCLASCWFIHAWKSQRITWNNKSKVENCANKERRKRPSRESVITHDRSAPQERFGQRVFFAQRMVQGSLNYQPNQCTITREIPKTYRKLCIVCFPQNG